VSGLLIRAHGDGAAQDAVRGDHMEVIALLQKYGGKVCVLSPPPSVDTMQSYDRVAIEEA